MIICFIAWGSLLWNNDTLKLENEWKKSNVKLPLNFSRISDGGNGRLTLVIDKDGILNNVYYGKTKINQLNTAINILKNREKTSFENIGYINILNNTKRTATLDEKYIQLLINSAKKNKIDAIISTGPPHSMHLIAMGLKQEFNLPWIADFRDPWTQIDFYSQLKLSSFADNKHKKLEHQVLTQADKVVTISPSCGKDLEKLGNRKVDVSLTVLIRTILNLTLN